MRPHTPATRAEALLTEHSAVICMSSSPTDEPPRARSIALRLCWSLSVANRTVNWTASVAHADPEVGVCEVRATLLEASVNASEPIVAMDSFQLPGCYTHTTGLCDHPKMATITDPANPHEEPPPTSL